MNPAGEMPDLDALAETLGVSIPPLTLRPNVPDVVDVPIDYRAEMSRAIGDALEPAPAALPLREDWLAAAVERLRPVFERKGFPLPAALRVSCGFPSRGALSRKARVIGQCWHGVDAADGMAQVFVSPVVSDTEEVLGVLVHELGHAALGPKIGHKGRFIAFCKALYLEGKPTHTTVGDEFKRYISPLVAPLGKYPHAALTPTTAERKQSTRLLKVECAVCGYICRVTAKWLLDAGAPVCPTDEVPMQQQQIGE